MIPVLWHPRDEPLTPAAVVATGAAARALVQRALQAPDRLRGVANNRLVILLGDDLPWVDGAKYLGRDPAAPGLYLPTNLAPSVPPLLLERALLNHASGAGAPLAIVLEGESQLLVPLAGARPLDRERLDAWLRSAA